MVRVRFDVKNLVQWGERRKTLPVRLQAAAVRALNKVGGNVVEEMVDRVAGESGLATSTVRRKFRVQRATASDLTFSVSASEELILDRSSRPMRGRQFARRPDSFFRPEELVTVVTMEDELVCPLCEAIAEGSPYTIEEARRQIPHHPNCRCLVEPFMARGEVPVEFRPRHPGGGRQTGSMRVRELAEALRQEVRVELRAR